MKKVLDKPQKVLHYTIVGLSKSVPYKMKVIIKNLFFSLIFLLLIGPLFIQKANAASLISVSDTLTTSRPSAAAPLSANLAANSGQAQIFDNGSFFLASDSAVIYPDTGETAAPAVNVASMSATGVPSSTNRIVYFTNTFTQSRHQGDVLITNVTAKHTIKFTTVSTIPVNGYIVITFPGAAQNTASPSATGFSFNNLANTNVTFSGGGVNCTGTNLTVSAPTITCHTSAQVNGGSTITATVGSNTPQLINPAKTPNNPAGTADAWKVTIQTQDNNQVNLDYAALRVGTIEAVTVQALVEPTITFTIAGIPDNTTFNSVNASCALNGGNDKTNSGIGASATNVNLGLLNSGNINASGQTLTVSTNGSSGYAITATSSGHFINPASGFFLTDANGGSLTANDTPVPGGITAGTADFGISPCGSHVPTSSPTYGGASGVVFNGASASTALFTNPWNTGTNSYYATITSYTGGPVSNDQTVIRYAAAVSGTTPAGVYTTTISYVATATF